jgi:metallophosphoesterase superfamily enzyme
VTKRIVILPDTQIPYHDRKALRAVIRFIGKYQPDEVVHIGDVMDYPQPSRWNKGTAGEFEGSVFRDSEIAKRELFQPLRDVYDGPVKVHEGNHDERPRSYLEKYAPALAESGAFNLDKLLDFERFGVELLPDTYDVAPGWQTTHGHKGGITLSTNAGYTALGAAKRALKSVVMGHTHRCAVTATSYGRNQKVEKVLHGFEVGHLMDMKQAHYLKGAAGNWQQAFGLLHIEKTTVQPVPVYVTKGRFVVDGKSWEV